MALADDTCSSYKKVDITYWKATSSNDDPTIESDPFTQVDIIYLEEEELDVLNLDQIDIDRDGLFTDIKKKLSGVTGNRFELSIQKKDGYWHKRDEGFESRFHPVIQVTIQQPDKKQLNECQVKDLLSSIKDGWNTAYGCKTRYIKVTTYTFPTIMEANNDDPTI